MTTNNIYIESIEPTNVTVNSTNSVRVLVAHRIDPVIISIIEPDSAPNVSIIRPTPNVKVLTSHIENDISVRVTEKNPKVRVAISGIGPQGPQGIPGSTQETFESVSKNLKNYSATFNYTGENLTSIVYNTNPGIITKTLNYTGENLTSIVLSGNTPAGIELTKTFNYTGENLTSIVYS